MVEVRLQGLPNEDLVVGFPGVAATWPRIVGEVRLHESSFKPLAIQKVTVGLYRTDTVIPPTTRSAITGTRKEQSFLVTREKDIWTGSTEEIYGLDIPFTLSLPSSRPMPPSISVGRQIETTYHLFVGVVSSRGTNHSRFPVRIKKFDTLSTFGTFHRPILQSVVSPDHLTSLEYSIPVSAFGPRDTINVSMRAIPNLDWPKAKKVRVRRISLELVQIFNFTFPVEDSDDFEREKRHRIAKVARELTADDAAISKHEELRLEIPGLRLGGIAQKDRPEVPNEGLVGFTTSAALYKIGFILILKARFSHAKDIETEQPITMSQFDHATCSVYMQSAVEAARLAKIADRRSSPARVSSRPLSKKVEVR